MSQSDLSAEALAQLAELAGADPRKSRVVPSFPLLMLGSIRLYPEIKGSLAYREQLEAAAKDLYQQIRTDPSVLSYIASGKSVLGDDNKRGVIKPFLPKHERENRQALTWLLHSMAYVASAPTKSEKTKGGKIIRDRKYVGIPLANAHFGTVTKGKDKGENGGDDKVKYPLKRDRLSQMVYALAAFHVDDVPWVFLYPGVDGGSSDKGIVTHLELLPPIKDFLVRHQLVFARHPQPKVKRKKDKPLLVVNVAPKGVKKAKNRPLDRELSEPEGILPELNNKLKRQQVTLHLPNYTAYRSHWRDKKGKSRLKMWGRKQLYRSFRFEDGKAGRLYGHFVQRLPGDARQYLRIDNQPVVELDYSAMQLVMLYADKGVRVPKGDPHKRAGGDRDKTPEVDLYKMAGGDRDIMKTVLTHSVGNATKAKTLKSLRKAFKDSGIKPSRAERLYDQFWAVHSKVCPHDAEQGPWPWLQNIDSEIALRVLRLLYDQGIDAIPIHDSFIVKAKHKDALDAAMQQAWQERYPDTDIRIK